MHTIVLEKREAEGQWVAIYNDPEVIRLFGTSIIPTAYTSQAPEYKVRDAIQALNPDCKVLVYDIEMDCFR